MSQELPVTPAHCCTPDKDLESPSSTRLEALVPSRDSRARTHRRPGRLRRDSAGSCGTRVPSPGSSHQSLRVRAPGPASPSQSGAGGAGTDGAGVEDPRTLGGGSGDSRASVRRSHRLPGWRSEADSAVAAPGTPPHRGSSAVQSAPRVSKVVGGGSQSEGCGEVGVKAGCRDRRRSP